jgi:hypothetical protein
MLKKIAAVRGRIEETNVDLAQGEKVVTASVEPRLKAIVEQAQERARLRDMLRAQLPTGKEPPATDVPSAPVSSAEGSPQPQPPHQEPTAALATEAPRDAPGSVQLTLPESPTGLGGTAGLPVGDGPILTGADGGGIAEVSSKVDGTLCHPI